MLKQTFACVRLVVAVLVVVVVAVQNAAQAIPVGTINFAASANGAVATSNLPNGSVPQRGNDGLLGDGPTNSAAWGSNRIGATWTATFDPSATASEISEIRVYDRSCCTSFAPYTVELLNAANTPIYTNSTSTTMLRPATFAVPNITGAAKVRVSYTGGAPGDAYLGEVEAIGFNGFVGGYNSVGTQVLGSTITGATTPGVLTNARVVQLNLTETTPLIRADFAEFRVFNTLANNVALSSNGGQAYQRNDNTAFVSGFGAQPLADTAAGGNKANPNLNDNSTANFSDSVQYVGDFFGIILGANDSLSSVQIVNRTGCCGGQGSMQLQAYSDTARANLIYDGPVTVSRVNGATTNLQFQLGGTAVAILEDGRTYTMDIDGSTNLADMFTVRELQSAATQLVVDGDLVINLLNGTPDAGVSIQLFDADSFSGAFDSITLPSLPEGLSWDLSNLLIDGTLSIQVPEPSTFALVALGSFAALVTRRRRIA